MQSIQDIDNELRRIREDKEAAEKIPLAGIVETKSLNTRYLSGHEYFIGNPKGLDNLKPHQRDIYARLVLVHNDIEPTQPHMHYSELRDIWYIVNTVYTEEIRKYWRDRGVSVDY